MPLLMKRKELPMAQASDAVESWGQIEWVSLFLRHQTHLCFDMAAKYWLPPMHWLMLTQFSQPVVSGNGHRRLLTPTGLTLRMAGNSPGQSWALEILLAALTIHHNLLPFGNANHVHCAPAPSPGLTALIVASAARKGTPADS